MGMFVRVARAKPEGPEGRRPFGSSVLREKLYIVTSHSHTKFKMKTNNEGGEMSPEVDDTKAWQAVNCPRCSKVNLLGATYCAHCGYPMAGAPAPAARVRMGPWEEVKRKVVVAIGLGVAVLWIMSAPVAFINALAAVVTTMIGMFFGFGLTSFGVHELVRKGSHAARMWAAMVGIIALLVSGGLLSVHGDWAALTGFEMGVVGCAILWAGVHVWFRERPIIGTALGTFAVGCMWIPVLSRTSELVLLTLPVGSLFGFGLIATSVNKVVREKPKAAKIWCTIIGIVALTLGVVLISAVSEWAVFTGVGLVVVGSVTLFAAVYVWFKRW
jgi:ribosomal protein L37E